MKAGFSVSTMHFVGRLLSEGGQTLSSLTKQVILRPQQVVRRDTKMGFQALHVIGEYPASQAAGYSLMLVARRVTYYSWTHLKRIAKGQKLGLGLLSRVHIDPYISFDQNCIDFALLLKDFSSRYQSSPVHWSISRLDGRLVASDQLRQLLAISIFMQIVTADDTDKYAYLDTLLADVTVRKASPTIIHKVAIARWRAARVISSLTCLTSHSE